MERLECIELYFTSFNWLSSILTWPSKVSSLCVAWYLVNRTKDKQTVVSTKQQKKVSDVFRL